MKSLSFAALIALQLALAPPAAAKLSKAESGMAQTVEAERDRSLALLEKLVNQNSGSLNLEGVEKVGQMMRAELEPLGFKVEWKPMRDTRSEEHTSELQSLMRISYAVFYMKKNKQTHQPKIHNAQRHQQM